MNGDRYGFDLQKYVIPFVFYLFMSFFYCFFRRIAYKMEFFDFGLHFFAKKFGGIKKSPYFCNRIQKMLLQ